MRKAVLFDLDGTLLDRDQSLHLFIKQQYKKYKHHFPHTTKENFVERFIHLDQRGYVWKDRVYQQMVKDFAVTSITWSELLDDYIRSFHDYTTPFSSLEAILSVLKEQGFLLGIITNGLTDFQNKSIQALGLHNMMDAILISEKEGLKKPDAAIFIKALEILMVSPENSVYVGDHPHNDIKGALNAGMNAIWKKDVWWDPSFSYEHLIEDLSDLPSLVLRLLDK